MDLYNLILDTDIQRWKNSDVQKTILETTPIEVFRTVVFPCRRRDSTDNPHLKALGKIDEWSAEFVETVRNQLKLPGRCNDSIEFHNSYSYQADPSFNFEADHLQEMGSNAYNDDDFFDFSHPQNRDSLYDAPEVSMDAQFDPISTYDIGEPQERVFPDTEVLPAVPVNGNSIVVHGDAEIETFPVVSRDHLLSNGVDWIARLYEKYRHRPFNIADVRNSEFHSSRRPGLVAWNDLFTRELEKRTISKLDAFKNVYQFNLQRKDGKCVECSVIFEKISKKYGSVAFTARDLVKTFDSNSRPETDSIKHYLDYLVEMGKLTVETSSRKVSYRLVQ